MGSTTYKAISDAVRSQRLTNKAARVHAFNEWTHGDEGSSKWWSSYFFDCLVSTCSLTFISYAVGVHTDTASKHPVPVLASVGSLIENKLILPASTLDRGENLPLGRGGLGNGKFVYALIDHSLNISDFNFHIERGNPRRYERERSEFFNALVEAARANDIQLPPHPSVIVPV